MHLISIIPGIIAHRELLPVNEIAYYIFYYFFIIGFSEEISFRGFIQPRLFPALKKEWLTILMGGLLFVFKHYLLVSKKYRKMGAGRAVYDSKS